ncbi:hypothetical protein SAMN04244553_0199 [Nocardia amikacinitolerans]|uniref:Uncharacterized protein n=1 Tax=Nocardia amikacinitolerans TaxID=756689 RepID=A0A285KNI7_9NOCA|nr:hypothetical protein [Nocardia amikacinitolerans]MCP2275359.1 hypothetical protein [Nocardia amikacinitolerans]MCP2293600.1 hypothetical protein [Nocardia amikacinitolerans]SNY74204.1 hypothetical protein SAMN04244553_0199 [Nocardia amikacinitolerans]
MLRSFLVRYRIVGPGLILTFAIVIYCIGEFEGLPALVTAVGLGALASLVVCLGWDLWLDP